ncbi:MAG: glycosyltransferase [Streptococcaceae bacterium]|jgi:raffinose-raffinose alpha-galactotransferase|nr:glycosyltransferase [Streptococcaceae bacterium]
MSKKVSIVVSCYNHAEYIAQCLQSIFSQTYQNIELLVYNDGSTDNSAEVIKPLLATSALPELYFFDEANRGLSAVKNDALGRITGDFLLFVDSDNWLNEKHVEILLAKLEETSKDIAYTQLWDFENQRNILQENLEYSLKQELEGNLIDASSLIRCSKISGSRFDKALNNRALEDYDFWLDLILENLAAPVFVSETKLNYRVRQSSMSDRGNWQDYYENYFYILNKHQKSFSKEVDEAKKDNILHWIKTFDECLEMLHERTFQKEQQDEQIKALEEKVSYYQNSYARSLKNLVSIPLRKLRKPEN